MTDSRMDEVKIDRKLKGKTNFVSWKREFERAAKNHDILEYLTGEEIVPPKPRKEDYFEKLIENDTRRLTRSMSRGMATTQSATPPTDEGEDAYDAQAMVPANNALQWQIDYKEHKVAKSQMKLAGRLLDAWVSDGIKIEIEDYPDAKDAYDFIKKRYAVTNERARDGLLSQLNSLKLAGCSCMTEYTNRIRQIKADLKTVKYDMTDDMLATALLNGLPANFNDFKEKYDWIRSTNPDDPPDLDYLYDRLHVEEAKHSGLREERKAKDKGRRDANTSHDSTSYSGNRKPKRQDRSHLKCTYPGCGKSGHSEDTCWTKDPSKAPRSLKNRIAAGADDNPIDAIGATTETNLDTFRNTYSHIDDLGIAPSSTFFVNTADTSPQTRSVEARRKVLDSEGVGTSCTPDTWLADTGANMHIVNDTKWFQKDSFRPFDNCALDISTADCSSTLEIKGGGTVRVVLRNPDGSATTVSLSEVAFAPQGKCNLFSGGLFAQKAKLTGVYNHQYMTWVDTRNQRIGHARFIDGLYHLNIEKAPGLCHSRAVVAATVNFDDPVWRWHRRLGHLGLQNMLGLLNSSTGMEITAAQIKAKLKAVCPVCAVTRALVKIPRDPAKRHAQKPGQMVHVDTWGPYPIEGFDGTKYFLFITDDCTRYTWSARFDRKGQLLEVFKSLVKFIEKAYDITIRCCRLDNEFERGPVGRWCDAHAIAREPIEPYAHYQNGISERANRTIRERAAPMVQETSISGQVSKIISEKGTELMRISSIPENLWPEAIQHSIWLKNRTPARALRKKDARTPYEALRGDKPSLTRERIWGSRAYITYPTEFRSTAEMTKLHSPRGWLGYFVGCESEAMYRIYSPEQHKVYRIGVARVEDGEGLDDRHDAPCLEDRIHTKEVEIRAELEPDNASDTTSESDSNDGENDDHPSALTEETDPLSGPKSLVTENVHRQTRHDGEEADGESSDDTEVISKFFVRPGHASMVKRKQEGDLMVAPKRTRQATHNTENDSTHVDSSSTEIEP
ncbi:Ribonuclease H-like protein [Beauveria brongniartii RCEF 3172]|uniref:Ribonuclease H-like protein n=1 Tax=Beauveria brongniartii RCEF 3172 TaxID=1081107 RepID=A0A166N7W6_9HYPO|nr:Ribonuclease H-like protein [Beauveria brongniartii RCEF 3172]